MQRNIQLFIENLIFTKKKQFKFYLHLIYTF